MIQPALDHLVTESVIEPYRAVILSGLKCTRSYSGFSERETQLSGFLQKGRHSSNSGFLQKGTQVQTLLESELSPIKFVSSYTLINEQLPFAQASEV